MKDFIKKNSNIILIIALIFILPMFIWSGVNKILNFDKKVKTLDGKLPIKLPRWMENTGMIAVLALEIFGSIILILSAFYYKNRPHFLQLLTNIVIVLFLIFLVVVTILYHPPGKKMIPFLSNLCDFGAFILVLCLFNL